MEQQRYYDNQDVRNNVQEYPGMQYQQTEDRRIIPNEPGPMYPANNMMQEIRPTTIDSLRTYLNGKIIELPAFADGQPFVCRMKRPSLLAMVKEGKIPNKLLTTANTLFTGGLDSDDEKMLEKAFGVIESICESSMMEPTYQQLKEVGIELTDEQMMFIFNYAQKGAKALESFR